MNKPAWITKIEHLSPENINSHDVACLLSALNKACRALERIRHTAINSEGMKFTFAGRAHERAYRIADEALSAINNPEVKHD